MNIKRALRPWQRFPFATIAGSLLCVGFPVEGLEEMGIELAGAEAVVAHEGTVEWDCGLDAFDDHFVEAGLHAVDGLLAVRAKGDDLADERIVIRRYLVAGIHVAIEADSISARGVEAGNRSRGGTKIFFGILGIDPAFDGVSFGLARALRNPSPGRDMDLLANEIEANDLFGHGMLNLYAGVHFHEVKLPSFIEEEFNGSRANIPDARGTFDGRGAHGVADFFGDDGRRRFLDELLVTALNGALALVVVDDRTVRIAEDLNFDMARFVDIFFDIDVAIVECGGGFGLCHRDLLRKVVDIMDDAHSLSATAGDSFDDNWEPNGLGDLSRFVGIFNNAIGTHDNGNSGRLHRILGAGLIAHRFDHFGFGTDEGKSGGVANVGKFGVLGEESVAGMNRFGASEMRGADDARDVEVTFASGWRTDADGLIGKADMERMTIRLGINGDGFNAHLAAGADDTERDFAAVGYEDFMKQSLGNFQNKQRLSIFDRLAVLDQDLHDLPCCIAFDFVHQLHRFDDTECGAIFDLLPYLDIRIGVGRGRAVECTDNRRFHLVGVRGWSCCGGGRLRWCRLLRWHGIAAHLRHGEHRWLLFRAAKRYAGALFVDLQLGERARFE